MLVAVGLLACAAPVPPRALAEADGPAPHVQAELVADGPLRDRLAPPDDADLVLFYGSELDGSLETCGCPVRPRGSVARIAGYVQASAARHEVPHLLLDAGNWRNATGDDGALRADAVRKNEAMRQALAMAGYDVLNVGYRDLPGLEPWPDEAVSAVVGDSPYRILERGGLRIGVTGVSRAGLPHLQPEGAAFADPVEAVRAVLPELEQAADLVVVLAYEIGASAERIVRLPGVDVLIEAGGYESRFDPFVQGDAVWVRTHTGTQRLGELRLVVEDGRVRGAVDRKIDLDDAVRPDKDLLRLERETRESLDVLQQELFGRP